MNILKKKILSIFLDLPSYNLDQKNSLKFFGPSCSLGHPKMHFKSFFQKSLHNCQCGLSVRREFQVPGPFLDLTEPKLLYSVNSVRSTTVIHYLYTYWSIHQDLNKFIYYLNLNGVHFRGNDKCIFFYNSILFMVRSHHVMVRRYLNFLFFYHCVTLSWTSERNYRKPYYYLLLKD